MLKYYCNALPSPHLFGFQKIVVSILELNWELHTLKTLLGSELDARQAISCRNTLCRTMYSRLFTWLINKINDLLKSNKREKNLALLDFYGFENLDNNYFEQLTINYCSEKIHQVWFLEFRTL